MNLGNSSAQILMKRFGLRAIAPTAPCAFAVTLLMAGVVSGQEPASIVVQGAAPGLPVAPTMFGLFFEDINYGADGGLYAELVENRSFEHGQPLHGWNTVARGAAS